jgi:hypothetical protein
MLRTKVAIARWDLRVRVVRHTTFLRDAHDVLCQVLDVVGSGVRKVLRVNVWTAFIRIDRYEFVTACAKEMRLGTRMRSKIDTSRHHDVFQRELRRPALHLPHVRKAHGG